MDSHEANLQRLLLVDGHAYAYRSFHAIRELTSPTGEPTNAIYGFIKAVQRLRTSLKPSHEAVIWDGGLAPERLALLPAYKAQRPPMPPTLEAQLDGLAEWVKASGSCSDCRPGVEADDGIATLAVSAAKRAWKVVIASSDKDFMQLVGPSIGLINPNDKLPTLWGETEVVAKTGVKPQQVVDWLSLVGDSVDNIPGVRGVGTKTAAVLLQTFGTAEGLLARLSEVHPDRIRAAVEASAAAVRRNREMIRLRCDLELGLELEDLRLRPPDVDRLRALYSRWGFKSLLADLPEAGGSQPELFSPQRSDT